MTAALDTATQPAPTSPSSAGAAPNTQWRTHGRGAHRRVAGLHVLRLEGSQREMGRQHGALLRDEIATGPIPYYRQHFHKLVGRSALGPAAPLVLGAVQTLVGRRVARNIPDFALETILGIAEGAGIDAQEMVDGCTMPDSLLWLAARVMQAKVPGPAVVHRLSLGLGCTSAVAWGGASSDGRLLHARNFDYHGVGCWPQSAALMFHRPDSGMRFVSVAAAGVGLGGITAMNEAGLSLTVHQHMFTDRARLGGTPIGTVGDRIMREASSLDEAERILRAYQPIGCWTYVITDAKTREVLCWEENPDRQVGRRYREEELFGYANVYLDEALGQTEVNLYGSYWRHNAARHRRAGELLRERHGALDPQAMAEILANPGSERCRIADAISMVMTVGSVVFRPEDGAMWIGIGPQRGNCAPTSGGNFIPFSLKTEDVASELPELDTHHLESPRAREAYAHYRNAYVAYVDEHDVPRARAEMDRARTIAPEQPLYHYLSGLCALSVGDAVGACDALDRAVELGHPHEQRRAACHLWRGRARELRGVPEDARRDTRTALALAADPSIHAAAKKDLRKRYEVERTKRIQIDFSMADVVTA